MQIRSRSTRVLIPVGLSILSIGLMAVPIAAQVLYGTVVGIVKDSTGARLPGAAVTLVNKDTNLTLEATTDAQGNYSLINVQPGPYDLTVALQGFREVKRGNIPVTIGEISRIDVGMEVATLSETVMVLAESPLLQTDVADIHGELGSKELTSLPLNRFRNYQALLNLVPGTTPLAFGNSETDTPARSMATNINGQPNTQNSTRTDGATNVNVWLPNHVMYVSPAETIETVHVSTSSFDAEQGMAGGAAVTVITKSGTNQFRGSAFEGFNNQSLNAKPYYFNPGPAPENLPVKTNNYGATVGGPIQHNKVFFFGSFEGYNRRQSLFTFFNVPDAALRAGDFSHALNTNGSVQNIYNPFTGNSTGTGRLQFANNQIPAGMINPIALKILQLYPMPNIQGIGAGGLSNNYERQENRTVDRQNYDAKFNWQRTSAHQIWAKFSHMNANVADLTNYLIPDYNNPNNGGHTKVYQLTSGQTWTLTPTLLMDSTFGFSRQKQDVEGPDFGAGNFGLTALGIPGTNNQGNLTQPYPERYAGYPQFQTGFSDVGNRDGWNPIFRDERTYSVTTNLTKIVGRHDLRGGYFLNFLYLDHWQPETGNPRGQLTFATNATALNGGQAPNFYNQYAAFLMGLVGTAAKSVQNELMTAREWQHALYFRDRWTPSTNLTLDLGLRWEYYPIMHRADGRGLDRLDISNPDFQHQLDVIIAGRGGNPQNNGMKAGLANFAPRVGGIYRIGDATVVRSGYGITYNAQGWARAVRGDNDYPVTIASSYVNPNDPSGFGYFGTLDQGIPLIVGPNLSSGRIPLDRAAAEYTPEINNIDRGYIQTWNVAFERRLPHDIAVDAAYVGAKGTGGYAALDINAPLVLGGANPSRPYASLGRNIAINSWGQRLRTRYDSLQIAVNKPFTHGLLIKGAYTLSKAMNESDADGRATLTWNTPSQLYRNWAPAGFDRRHNLQLGFVYALPWQSSGGFGSFAKALADDWQINGVFAAFSGTPFTVTAAGASLNTPSNQQVADLTGSFNVTDKIAPNGAWFDTTQFAQPTGVRFGNTGRNQFYGPGGNNLDLSIFRIFPMGGQRRLEARIQIGNIFNSAVFANPQGSFTSNTFGQITGIAGGSGAQSNAAYPERSVVLGVRFSF